MKNRRLLDHVSADLINVCELFLISLHTALAIQSTEVKLDQTGVAFKSDQVQQHRCTLRRRRLH
jgi:hypothetical protein